MITNLEFVKSLNPKILTDEYDVDIEYLIPLVEADYLNIRNCDFDTDDEGEIIYPDGSNWVSAQMIRYKLGEIGDFDPVEGRDGDISSEKIGSYAASYNSSGLANEKIIGGGYPLFITGSIKSFIRGE